MIEVRGFIATTLLQHHAVAVPSEVGDTECVNLADAAAKCVVGVGESLRARGLIRTAAHVGADELVGRIPREMGSRLGKTATLALQAFDQVAVLVIGVARVLPD